MKAISKNIQDLKRWEKCILLLTIFFLTVYLFLFIFLLHGDGILLVILSMIATIFGILGVVYSEKRSLSNYFLGGVHVLLYGGISFYSALYGDFFLNIFYFLPMQFVGYFLWKKNTNDKDEKVKVRAFSKSYFIFFAIFTIVFYFGFSIFIKFLGDPIPYIDSGSTTFSILGMILMVYGYWEQWIFWIVVNIITIVMWAFTLVNSSSYYSISLIYMWTVYLSLSIIGLIKWKGNYRSEKLENVFARLDVGLIIEKNILIEESLNVGNYVYCLPRNQKRISIKIEALSLEQPNINNSFSYLNGKEFIYNLDWNIYKEKLLLESKWLEEEQL